MISALIARKHCHLLRRGFFCLVILTSLGEGPVFAATKSWLAPAFGGDRRWSVGANWGGTAPVNGDSLNFNQKSDSTFQDPCTNNLSSLQLGSILFNGIGNAVPDLFGNGITLSGGISEGVSFWGASVGMAVTLSASQTFESLLDGHLDLASVNVGVHTLTLSTRLSTSRINLLGRLSGSGVVEISGPGSVAFNSSQNNTFSGPNRVVEGGRLDLRSRSGTNGIPSVVGDLIVGDGITASDVGVYADNQIDGDVTLRTGSQLYLGALDALPSLTMIDATALVAADVRRHFCHSRQRRRGGHQRHFLRPRQQRVSIHRPWPQIPGSLQRRRRQRRDPQLHQRISSGQNPVRRER